MVLSDWDLAPKCVCGPNFTSDLTGESPILPAARIVVQPAFEVLLDMYSVTGFWGRFVSNYLIFDMPDIGSNTGFSG